MTTQQSPLYLIHIQDVDRQTEQCTSSTVCQHVINSGQFFHSLILNGHISENLTSLLQHELTVHRVFSNGWWRWALVSPDGVAPSRMVCLC